MPKLVEHGAATAGARALAVGIAVLCAVLDACAPRATGRATGQGGSHGGGVDSGDRDGGLASGGSSGTGGATSGTGGASTTGSAGAGGMPRAGEGPIDAEADRASSPDASAGTACAGLFCEDFETGAIDPAIWDIKFNGGQAAPNVVPEVGLVAHGRYAAHFHANPNVVSYDFMITRSPPAALRGHHFGRAYFMITPAPPTNHTEYIYAGTTGFPQYKYLEVASAAPLAWQLTFVNEIPPNTGEDYHSGGTVPIGRWFCLEWDFDDAPDRAAVFVDGAPAFSQNMFTFGGATTGLVGGFAAFGFGYYAWHPATYPFDVYYDDIVLDIKRVGCLN